NDAADPNMRSVRIGIDYRGIVLKPDKGDVYCMLWIDRHDDAYDWARRHRITIHPDVGTIQVMETSHAASEAPGAMAPESEKLFKALKDRELARLGVPVEHVPLVRSIGSVEELEASEATLPDDAFEALYLFAAGESYESLVRERETPEAVDPEDYAEALER